MDHPSSKNSERQNCSPVKKSDWIISVTNDCMFPSVNSVRQPKQNCRKIRGVQDFNTLNRSSLGAATLHNLEIIQEKKKTKKQKAISFLPKVNAEDKESISSLPSCLTEEVEIGVALKSTNNFPRSPKFVNDDFNSQQSIPYSDAKDESDDEVEIKPRKKKSTDFVSEERPIVQSDCILLEKSSPKTSCERTPIVKKAIEKLSGTIEGGSNGSEKTHKSVRFVSSPEKVPKRNTFDVETSIIDVSLLPVVDAEDSCKKHILYKKSPHVNKIKRLTEKGKNTGEFKNINLFSNDISMRSLESANNNSSIEKSSPIYACRQSSRKSSNNCKTMHRTEASGDQDPLIIDLVTPTQEEISLSTNKIFTEQLSQKCWNQPSALKSQNAKEMVLKEDNSGMNLDALGVGKRRKWSRSCRASILDSSGFIHNVSSPWNDKSRIDYFSSSTSKQISCTEEGTPKRSRRLIKTSDKVLEKNFDLNTHPSGTSTPLVVQQKSMLPQVLLSAKSNSTLPENKSINKFVTRTKMPDFARIHQRAYEKLENIKEMSERKAIRAKLLLSGIKPEAELPEDFKGKSKKMLKYSPEKNHISTDISIKKSCPKKLLPVPVKGVKKSTQFIVVKPTATKLAPSTSKSKISVRQTQKENVTSYIPRSVHTKTNQEKSETISRFGFKPQNVSNISTKNDQVKAVANKSRILTNSLDKRRQVVQNVRSNRRFELLMQMRKNQKKL